MIDYVHGAARAGQGTQAGRLAGLAVGETKDQTWALNSLLSEEGWMFEWWPSRLTGLSYGDDKVRLIGRVTGARSRLGSGV